LRCLSFSQPELRKERGETEPQAPLYGREITVHEDFAPVCRPYLENCTVDASIQ
jgi:hypothetical protein